MEKMHGNDDLTFGKTMEINNIQSSLSKNESLTQIQDQFQVQEDESNNAHKNHIFLDLLKQGLQYNEIVDLLSTLNKKMPPINDLKAMQINPFHNFNKTKSHKIMDRQLQDEKKAESTEENNQIDFKKGPEIDANINLTNMHPKDQVLYSRDPKINKKHHFSEFILKQQKFMDQKKRKIQKFQEILRNREDDNEIFIPKIDKRSSSLGHSKIRNYLYSLNTSQKIHDSFCNITKSQIITSSFTFRPKILEKSQKLKRNYKMLYEFQKNKEKSIENQNSVSIKTLIDEANKCFTLKMSEKQNMISLLNKIEDCKEIMTRKEMNTILFNLSLLEPNNNEEANLLYEILKDKNNLIKKEHLAIALIVILKINYPNIKLINSDSKSPQIKG